MALLEIVWHAPGGVKKTVIMAADVTPREALSTALGRLALPLDRGLLAKQVGDMCEIVQTDRTDLLEPGQYVILDVD